MSKTNDAVLNKLVDAVNHISRGSTNSGPTGFELLSMAIEGEGGRPGNNSLSDAIRDSGQAIALSIDNLASAIRELNQGRSAPAPATAPEVAVRLPEEHGEAEGDR